jgi:stage II sporulation protein P
VVAQGIPGQLEQPYRQHNLSLAVDLSNWLEKYYPGLSRGVRKYRSRYNQHLAPGALLVEVGEVRNTLEQAKASARILAHAVASQLLIGRVETAVEVDATGD